MSITPLLEQGNPPTTQPHFKASRWEPERVPKPSRSAPHGGHCPAPPGKLFQWVAACPIKQSYLTSVSPSLWSSAFVHPLLKTRRIRNLLPTEACMRLGDNLIAA